MKNDDLFDKKVREIFKCSDYSEDTFDKAFNKLNKNNNMIVYFKYVASFTIIIIISIFAITYFNKNENLIANNSSDMINETDTANSTDSQNEEIETDNNIYSIPQNAKILMSNSYSRPIVQLPNGLDYEIISSIKESDCIAMVKLDKILYGMNYIEKTKKYVYPVTVSSYTIEKTFKGNLSGKIKIATDTETLLPIDDYVKGGFKEEAQRLGYNEMSEEERKNTYVTIPTLQDYTRLKEGDYYIAYLKYNSDAEMYGIFNYCFFEYDKDTNQIRIPGTDNYEEFSLKDYDYLFTK